jgi:hypothetical protein
MIKSFTPQKILSIGMLAFSLLFFAACHKTRPQSYSDVNTMAPKYNGAFQKQCSSEMSTSKPFPGRAVTQSRYQTVRFHRFGPDGPGRSERLVRQEIRQEVMRSEEGQPCGMAPITHVSTYLSSDYDALLKYENTSSSSKSQNLEIPAKTACNAVTLRKDSMELKADTKVLLVPAPFTDGSRAWVAATYKKSYAVFTITGMTRLGGGDPELSSVLAEGHFDHIVVDNGHNTKILGPGELGAFVGGSPVYGGDVVRAEDPGFIPEATYGWVQSVLQLNKKEFSSDGKTHPVHRLVIQSWK